jgi:CRISPR/Cas system-associated endoribonuclease Cas2
MLFLVVYDVAKARVTQFAKYHDHEYERAADRRLRTEMTGIRQKRVLEVVLLEAESEAVIHRTHARYFEDLRGILAGWN